jgi:hypothetical protein
MDDNCTINVNLIQGSENIGDSLSKINNNFSGLKTAACDLENRINNIVNIRTFFYYGPNSATDSESGVNSGNLTLPSNTTIENFTNKTTGLNLIPYSEKGDIVYVIYQKTGWYTNVSNYQRSGSGSVPYSRNVQVQKTRTERVRRIGIGWTTRTITYWENQVQTFYAGYSWSASINDTYNVYTPIFAIYRLNFNGTKYLVETGFPKFTRSSTNSTLNWNNPTTWSTY